MTSWFTSTLETVREKSFNALEFVRKDLSEFTITVKSDTETYLNKIKSQPVGELGINRIVSKLSKTDAASSKHISASASFDRLQHERTRLQNDESTYLIDPIPSGAYENWRQTKDFNIDKHKGEIAQILIDAPHVRSIYARLVPARINHSDFWSRYYFRLYQLNEEETRRVNLLKRAHEICNEKNGNDWDEPDDEWSKEVTIDNEQSTLTMSENITHERKESDTGDSWEREFDDSDLSTSKTNEISINQLQAESLSLPVTTAKKTDNEFDDDEWESWS